MEHIALTVFKTNVNLDPSQFLRHALHQPYNVHGFMSLLLNMTNIPNVYNLFHNGMKKIEGDE